MAQAAAFGDAASSTAEVIQQSLALGWFSDSTSTASDGTDNGIRNARAAIDSAIRHMRIKPGEWTKATGSFCSALSCPYNDSPHTERERGEA
jgi:hypothetical protein